MFAFRFKGGIDVQEDYDEKFLAFLIIEGEEHSLAVMQQVGLVQANLVPVADKVPAAVARNLGDQALVTPSLKKALAGDYLLSRHPLLKIFCWKKARGRLAQRHSFFVQLSKEGNYRIRILPFGLEKSGYFFETDHGILLSPKEVSPLLKDRISKQFAKEDADNPLPKRVYDAMVHVDQKKLIIGKSSRKLKI